MLGNKAVAKSKIVMLVFLACCLILVLGVMFPVVFKSDIFVLEAEKHWETFGVGGTCCFGGHNLAVADIDGDSLKEMMTGGYAYYVISNSTAGQSYASFKVWSWNGKELALEMNYSWTGYMGCVYSGDIDGDGNMEVVTAGGLINSTRFYSSLRVWTFNGETLVLAGNYEGEMAITSVFTSDVDGNEKLEILATCVSTVVNSSDVKLLMFKWDGTQVKLVASVNCFKSGNGRLNSVYACDLDCDGAVEIVTAGYRGALTNSSGYLGIWHFNGTSFSAKGETTWQKVKDAYSVDISGDPMGNTMVSKVKAADVDGDGVHEIVTGGFTFDSTKVEGQLRIWNWSNGTLNLEKSREWKTLDITQVTSLSFGDVDGDGEEEIVTSGYTAGYNSWASNTSGKSRGELKIWNYDGHKLSLEQDKNWIVGDAFSAWNVEATDVDNDVVVEIITVGCMQTGNLCDPDLRIWTINSPRNIYENPYFFITVPVALAAVTLTLLIVTFKKHKRTNSVKIV